MTNKPQSENQPGSVNLIMKKLGLQPPVDKTISDGHGSVSKHAVQVDSEEMKEETHELEQVEQDEQEEIREIEDQE